jgi:hypothetical protein
MTNLIRKEYKQCILHATKKERRLLEMLESDPGMPATRFLEIEPSVLETKE